MFGKSPHFLLDFFFETCPNQNICCYNEWDILYYKLFLSHSDIKLGIFTDKSIDLIVWKKTILAQIPFELS